MKRKNSAKDSIQSQENKGTNRKEVLNVKEAKTQNKSTTNQNNNFRYCLYRTNAIQLN